MISFAGITGRVEGLYIVMDKFQIEETEQKKARTDKQYLQTLKFHSQSIVRIFFDSNVTYPYPADIFIFGLLVAQTRRLSYKEASSSLFSPSFFQTCAEPKSRI
jgi:hypothetical protein